MNVKPVHMVAAGAVGLALVYVALRGMKGVAADIGGAAIDLADGVLSGAVETVGEKVGIPRTNMTKCELALAQGRTWDASFDCPAATFIRSFF